jgi:hypothetical protein
MVLHRLEKKKYRYLTHKPFEGTDALQVRKVVSQRHALKTMFNVVVREVNEENDFDGKILLERISENKILNRTTYQNNALKAGEWKELYLDDPAMVTSEFIQLIVEFFNLDDTGEFLCLRYMTYPNGVKRVITLGEDEAILCN